MIFMLSKLGNQRDYCIVTCT